jgi:hypothetical protein
MSVDELFGPCKHLFSPQPENRQREPDRSTENPRHPDGFIAVNAFVDTDGLSRAWVPGSEIRQVAEEAEVK